jgi:hypothetical protein
MNTKNIENSLRKKIGEKIRLEEEGVGRFRVFTPFRFEDGDHLSIVLKRDNSHWLLSDEGHTYMHVTYQIESKDLLRGTRQKIIANALSVFHVQDKDGELTVKIEEEKYGDALYSFIQALLKISDVTFLSRERVRSTFLEDFRKLISETIPEPRREFDWHDQTKDPQKMYIADCRVNGMARPIYIFALPSDDRTRDVTITILQFERWGQSFRSVGIFEDQESINRKVLARFSDICEKQFSTLAGNQERIQRYLKEAL